jgi:SAM-dependent methyltransferase
MLHILFFILQAILLIAFFVTTILFIFWAIGNVKNKVPFVTAPNAVMKDVDNALLVKDDSVVYDLGCGDGRILFYLSKIHPKARYIGIENSFFPFFLAKVESFFHERRTGNKVEIIYKNFFKQDLSDATHIVTYLYPIIMDDLINKFDKELKSGTRLVSISFKFTGKQPINEIDLKRSKYKLGRKLFVYQF